MQKDSRNNSPKRVNIDGTNLIKTKEKKKLDSEVKQLIKREFPMVNIDYDNFTDDDVQVGGFPVSPLKTSASIFSGSKGFSEFKRAALINYQNLQNKTKKQSINVDLTESTK